MAAPLEARIAPWLSSILAGSLAVLALSGCELVAPSLVIPVMVAALVTGLHPDWRRASAAAAAVWVLALTVLVQAPREPALLHLGNRILLKIAAHHFGLHWTPTALLLSPLWLALGLSFFVWVRRSKPGLAPWLALALLSVCFVLSATRFDPPLLANYASRPTPGYSFDGRHWMDTYYEMRDGTPFYEAFLEAFHRNARTEGEPPVLRSPVLYQLWSVLPDGMALVWVYLGLCVGVFAAAYTLALRAGAGEAALLAPVLLFPYFLFGVYGFYFPFVELWVSGLMLIAFSLYLWERRELGLLLALFAFVSRELGLMLFASLSLDYLVVHRKNRIFLVLLWAVAAVFYMVHRYIIFEMVGHQGELERYLRPGWLESLWAGLSFGFMLFPHRDLVILACALLGAAGAFLSARARVALCTAVASGSLFLMVVTHGGRMFQGKLVYLPDYWGSLLGPFLLALVPVALARLASLHGRSAGSGPPAL